MLKSLRKKFIITNMLLVGIVLVIVFITVCTNIYAIQKDEVARTLHAPFSRNTQVQNDMGFLTSIVVVTDNRGNLLETYLNGAVLDKATLRSVVSEAISSDDEKGKIRKHDLFYEKTEVMKDLTAIVFVDSHRMKSVMTRTIAVSVIAFALAMIIVYFISRFVAAIAIEPVRKSWEQQKQFVADASHELKTPLTVILANSQILKGRKDSTIAQEQKWIDSTVDEAVHMKALVEDMLFLARNDSGIILHENQQVNMSDMVEENILQFEPLAYEAGIIVNSEVEPEITITGNPTQLRQVMHILMDNAIKYTVPSGGPGDMKSLIDVRLLKSGKGFTLEVRNTGEVIEEGELSHLFDRFYRGDRSRTKTEDRGGYGLGLAIAGTIAENHGGVISADSGVDKGPEGRSGSVFSIKFN